MDLDQLETAIRQEWANVPEWTLFTSLEARKDIVKQLLLPVADTLHIEGYRDWCPYTLDCPIMISHCFVTYWKQFPVIQQNQNEIWHPYFKAITA